MTYILKWVRVTRKTESIDGKEHRHVLYFHGIKEPFGIHEWNKGKQGAYVFKRKSDAIRYLKEHPNSDAVIVEA